MRQATDVVLECCVIPLQLIVVAFNAFYFLDDSVEAILELVGVAIKDFSKDLDEQVTVRSCMNTFSRVSVCRLTSSPCLLCLVEERMSVRHWGRTPHA